jgi:FkbM family methyltransferase
MRILFVVERPTQFEAPFYRYAAARPEADFHVAFTRPDPGREVYDPELGREVRWGIDLLSGYSWRAPAPGEQVPRWVARQVRELRLDLVLVNGYTRHEYLAAAVAARLARVPAALRIDSVVFPGEPAPGLLRRLLVSTALTGLFRLFFTTGSLGRRYLESCGVAPARIVRFPYAVDVEHFRAGSALSPQQRRRERAALGLPPDARVILALTKFSGREAPWDLLKAFCSSARGDERLVLAGDGSERAALEDFAARSGAGRVLLPGYVPYPRLPALYGASDLFVHPAKEERWGVSVAEAMAAGLPVVASTRVGAAYDLVRPGENGRLYRAGDEADLAAALAAAHGLDPATVAATNRAVLETQDYRATWESLVEGAGRAGRGGSAGRGGRARAGLDPSDGGKARRRTVPRVLAALPRGLRRHKVVRLLVRLLPHARVATFRFNDGALVTADLADAAPRQALITGVFEPEFFAVAQPFVRPGTAVLDVGANYGFCTAGLAALTPPAEEVEFHLFEANPVLCRQLRETARLHPAHRMRVVEGCVTDRPGQSRLHLVEGHSGTSHVVEGDDGAQVRNVVLDSYLEAAGVERVSLVKLDVEGWEPQALRGLSRAIERGRIGALYVECSGPNLERRGLEPAALIGLMRDLGCEVFWCKEQDLESALAPPARRVDLPGGAALRLAPVRGFPARHQTDLLAIPRCGMYRALLEQLE